MRELGIPVTGCDAKRANRSNVAYKKALVDGYKPKGWKRKHRRKAADESKPVADRPRSTQGILRPAASGMSTRFDGIIDPIPGEVYEGAQRQPGAVSVCGTWWFVCRWMTGQPSESMGS